MKKISKILLTIITVLILLFTTFSIAVNKNYGNGVLGTKFFIVLSDSMKPEFKAGDIVVTKVVDPTTLNEGDIISYLVQDGRVLTHQIIEKKIVDSEDVFVTKGINSEAKDYDVVQKNNIIGKYSFSVPSAGNIILFIKKPIGFIITIFIPLLIIFIMNLLDFIKALALNKKKKTEKIDLEKLKLKQEIVQLKSQLKLSVNNGED